MVANFTNINNAITDRLAAGGLTELACCQLQNAQSIFANTAIYSVANTSLLPSASLNEGRFVYVEDIKEYRFSDGGAWIDDFSSDVVVYENQIWGWGDGVCGRLGDGTTIRQCSPVREISSSTDWNIISAGWVHSSSIKTDGSLWSWGTGTNNQLGDGKATSSCSPVRELCSATDWCYVTAGSVFTSAIKTDGSLWSWGSNGCGRLGDGTVTQRCSPVREYCSATDWCQASAGNFSVSAVKTSGELWSWGGNTCGVLGDGTITNSCSPVREYCSAVDWCQASVGCLTTAAIKTSGEIWTWGQNDCFQLALSGVVATCSPVREARSAVNWCQVSMGSRGGAAITTAGTLCSWGSGVCGRIGRNSITGASAAVQECTKTTEWCGVTTGKYATSAIKTTGQIWAWGCNLCGSLGVPLFATTCTPVQEYTSATDWCAVKTSECAFTIAIRGACKGFFE